MKKMKNHECPTFQSVFKWSSLGGLGRERWVGVRGGTEQTTLEAGGSHSMLFQLVEDIVIQSASLWQHPHAFPSITTLQTQYNQYLKSHAQVRKIF